MLLVAACSTDKNTPQTRFWHSFTAKYNTYYNGSQAYIDGSLEKENGNRDNFTEMIPLYTVANKSSKELGSGNFETAITKCEKAIHQHSIKKRPVWDKKRRKTAKDIEWLQRREYNPFIWKAWLLMGRAQFHKGAFEEAASTFSYMSRLFATQPAIYGKARAWLAKSYIEQDMMYDAEDVIRNMQRDSLDWRAVKEWDYTYADYFIHTGEFEKAIPYLRKVIKHEMRRKQKAREWYLLGQLYAALGQRENAYKAFKHVVRQNPPYEVEFNARIAMTEVMAAGQSKKMISKLRRMAANDNNKDYLDQVYYAIGNIYLAQRDTANAISAYEQGNKKATRTGVEKGVLLLHLGDLYWQKEKFSDAQRCYGEAIGLLDTDRDDYEQLSERSKVLDELVPFTEAVHLQDSLQALAKMNEKDRNAAIDRVIEALKKKEKEERAAQDEQNAQQTQARNGGTATQNTSSVAQKGNGQWYFYNPIAVSQGKATFQKLWGKRENVDNWQRVNKTVVAGMGDEAELTDAQRDSLARAMAVQDSLEQVRDSAQNDPHKREYYLAQIPFTEEQVAESNVIIKDGLYNSGVIFKDKLDNLRLSEKALRRITDQYPDYERMDDVYYHLFLLYSRMNQPQIADSYIQRLKSQHPQSQWTSVLTDPYFADNAKFGEHLEDSLYAATYEAFKADRYAEVSGNTHISDTRFPLGANRDKFIFIGGLSKLNKGDAKGCVNDMKTIVEKYPESQLSEMAGMIVNGVNDGKRLHGGKFDIGDIWERRSVVLNDSDSIAARTFSNERDLPFKVIIAYAPDSVNQNQLLYELAKFNFTNFLVRNFEINIEDANGVMWMQVGGFRNYDEAIQYARQLHNQEHLRKLTSRARTIVISETNLELLGTQFSYDEYDEFYAKHFAPLKVSTYKLLTEPAEIATQPEREPTVEEIDRELENGMYMEPESENPLQQGTTIPDLPQLEPAQSQGTTVIPEDPKPAQQQGTTVVPEEPTPAKQQGTTVIPEEPKLSVSTGTTVIPAEPVQVPTTGTTVIPDEPAQVPTTTGTTIIPDEPVQAPKVGTIIIPDEPIQTPTSGTIIIPDEPKKTSTSGTFIIPDEQKKAPTAGTIIIPDEPSSAKTTKQNKKSTKTASSSKANSKKKSQVDPSEIIYFDLGTPKDSTNVKQKATNKKQQNKKETKKFDLEDEYYDLNGF